MKKILPLLVILAVAMSLLLTCPDKQAHQQAVRTMMTEKFDQGVQKVTSGMMPGFAVLGSVLASNLSNIYLDSQLEVKNYFVLSVGEVSFKGKTYPVSVGVFNHVFVYEPTEEEMRRILEDLR